MKQINIADILNLKTYGVEKEEKQKLVLQPFDLVLCRDKNENTWVTDIYGYYDERYFLAPYRCVGRAYEQCIPYNEQTKHLLGTAEDWEGGNKDCKCCGDENPKVQRCIDYLPASAIDWEQRVYDLAKELYVRAANEDEPDPETKTPLSDVATDSIIAAKVFVRTYKDLAENG